MERIMTGSGKDTCSPCRRGAADNRQRRERCRRGVDCDTRHGFTLIEILVAMGILMLIVLMMATLFHQSSMAWENGLRQAEMSIQARSAMSIMRRDISQAVASEEYKCNFSGSSIDIYVLGSPTGSVRTIKRASYNGGNTITRSTSEYRAGSGGGYFGSPINYKSGQLMDNVEELQFSYPDPSGSGAPRHSWPSSTNLPPWVDVKLTLSKKTIGAAGIRVWSNGRDHTFDTDDDKKKRLRTWQD